jgi:hypothetical protein
MNFKIPVNSNLISTIVLAVVACVALYFVSKGQLPVAAAIAILAATHGATGASQSFVNPSAARMASNMAEAQAAASSDALKVQVAEALETSQVEKAASAASEAGEKSSEGV